MKYNHIINNLNINILLYICFLIYYINLIRKEDLEYLILIMFKKGINFNLFLALLI